MINMAILGNSYEEIVGFVRIYFNTPELKFKASLGKWEIPNYANIYYFTDQTIDRCRSMHIHELLKTPQYHHITPEAIIKDRILVTMRHQK